MIHHQPHTARSQISSDNYSIVSEYKSPAYHSDNYSVVSEYISRPGTPTNKRRNSLTSRQASVHGQGSVHRPGTPTSRQGSVHGQGSVHRPGTPTSRRNSGSSRPGTPTRFSRPPTPLHNSRPSTPTQSSHNTTTNHTNNKDDMKKPLRRDSLRTSSNNGIGGGGGGGTDNETQSTFNMTHLSPGGSSLNSRHSMFNFDLFDDIKGNNTSAQSSNQRHLSRSSSPSHHNVSNTSMNSNGSNLWTSRYRLPLTISTIDNEQNSNTSLSPKNSRYKLPGIYNI